jgi:hypothetical protein
MEIVKSELNEKATLDDLKDALEGLHKTFELKSLIAVYHCSYDSNYNEIYDIEKEQLIGPRPITEVDIQQIAKSSRLRNAGISIKLYASDFQMSKSGNLLLLYDPGNRAIAWFQKERIETVKLKSISEKPFQIVVPNMLMIYSKKGMTTYALSQKYDPLKKNGKSKVVQLYRSPFPNTYQNQTNDNGGMVCMGSVRLDISDADTVSEAIDIIDKSFWSGEFNDYHSNQEEELFTPYFQQCSTRSQPLLFPYKLLQKSHSLQL